MIKFFVKDEKLNAVDSDNRLIGFDINDDCCAYGGWFISETIIKKEPLWDMKSFRVELAELKDYVFDNKILEVTDDSEYNAIVVKMNPIDEYRNKELFLHLFNVHNGYYSKGFTYSNGETIVERNV